MFSELRKEIDTIMEELEPYSLSYDVANLKKAGILDSFNLFKWWKNFNELGTN